MRALALENQVKHDQARSLHGGVHAMLCKTKPTISSSSSSFVIKSQASLGVTGGGGLHCGLPLCHFKTMGLQIFTGSWVHGHGAVGAGFRSGSLRSFLCRLQKSFG